MINGARIMNCFFNVIKCYIITFTRQTFPIQANYSIVTQILASFPTNDVHIHVNLISLLILILQPPLPTGSHFEIVIVYLTKTSVVRKARLQKI